MCLYCHLSWHVFDDLMWKHFNVLYVLITFTQNENVYTVKKVSANQKITMIRMMYKVISLICNTLNGKHKRNVYAFQWTNSVKWICDGLMVERVAKEREEHSHRQLYCRLHHKMDYTLNQMAKSVREREKERWVR